MRQSMHAVRRAVGSPSYRTIRSANRNIDKSIIVDTHDVRISGPISLSNQSFMYQSYLCLRVGNIYLCHSNTFSLSLSLSHYNDGS
jgi:hypothetical protein